MKKDLRTRRLAALPFVLEERVVFSATLVGPEQVAVLPPSDTTPPPVAVSSEHFPGCGCGECVKFVTVAEDGTEETGYALPPIFATPREDQVPSGAPPFPGQTFTLHSRPTATRKIYLDFTGHTTSNTSWNSAFNSGADFVCAPFDMDGNPGSFSLAEEERIQLIWQRVMEDFSPFDVDVTTEDPTVAGLTYSGTGDTTWGMRVVITPTDGWYADTNGGVGGVAYVPSFKTNRDTTCYVFSSNLGPNSEKFIAEATSHEVGHTLGLGHDGTSTQGYYTGHNGWAPIMGVGYSQAVTQWSRGEYTGANNTQDDLTIITNTNNNFGYRPDNAGDTIATAAAATTNGSSLTAAGVIERTTDIDYFSFSTGTGNVSFNFNPYVNSPNLNIRAELRNSAGTVLATADPSGSLAATINFNIPTSGTYYLTVEGVGEGTGATGYTDYASLGQYTITGTIVAFVRLDTIETTPLNYTENQGPTNLTTTLVVNPGTNINQATVTIQNYVNGQDTLTFSNQAGITGNFNTGTGVLTLTGGATPAQYQTALRSITYNNPSQDPSTAPRTLQFQVRDINGVMSNVLARTLNVIAVNDAPTLNNLGNQLITEDAGQQTVNLVGISTGGENQTLTLTAVSNNPALIPNPNITYTSPNATGTLRYTPNANAFGVATITVTLRDSGNTVNGGINQIVRTFTVTVTPDANDAPVLDNSASPSFTAIPKNDTNAVGDALTLIIGDSITDPDANPLEGIAVIDATGTTNGTWQYSLDNGATWTSFGPISTATARLLRPTDMMRFVPNAEFIGVVQITYRAWDQFTGTPGGIADLTLANAVGGATAFSSATETASFYVAMGLTPVLEDSRKHKGDAATTLLSDFVADVDPNAKKGMAIVGLTGPTAGVWQYSTNGRSWKTISHVSLSQALLLRQTDRLRFVPAQDQYGYATVRYHAWDETLGKRGTYVDISAPTARGGSAAVSATDMIAFAQTTPLNDRPILDRGGDSLLTPLPLNASDPDGDTIAALIQNTIVDPDTNAQRGIAITSVNKKALGTWEYSLDSGTSWTAFPTVTTKTALLLGATDMVRFTPQAGFVGQATFTYKAWDQTEGIAGDTVNTVLKTSTAFSTLTDTAIVNVGGVTITNSAPVLNTALTPTLSPVVEDTKKPKGDLVSVLTFLGTAITDANFGTGEGIAITGLTGTTQGRWEWSANGKAWKPIANVSPAAAFLLRETDWLRYVPNPNSTTGASVTYHGWDQTRGTAGGRANLTVPGGTGGTSPFSVAADTASVTITPVNDAPTLYTAGNPVIAPPTGPDPAGVLISSFANPIISDPDNGALKGIAITKNQADFGIWEFSRDDGATWELVPIFPPLTDKNALLLRPNYRVRLNPFDNATGTASLSFKAWDRTDGTPGSIQTTVGSSAFSKETETVSMAFGLGNNRPTLDTTPSPMVVHPTGSTVASLMGTAITDLDPSDTLGIAIVFAPSSPTKGTWQFSLDGTTWTAITGVSGKNALVLPATAHVRYEATAGYYGTQQLRYKAWDGTSGTVGQLTPTNTTAFSKLLETALVNVNTAPELLL